MLPHGTGRESRVAVFAEGDKAKEAEEAGADVVGSADLAKRVEEGFTDFDVAIATPDQMGNVGRLGRVLGPRGLMPNPKTGTVTMDVAKAVREAKAGKLEYRTDRGANVHIPIGKQSFDERQLVENYAALIDEIVRAKPAASRRAATSRRSPSRARWAPGSTSTRRGRGTSSRSSTRARRRPFRLSRFQTPVAKDRWQPARAEAHPRRVEARASSLQIGPPAGGLDFREEVIMDKDEKERVVAELTERLRTAETLFVADYRGLTMPQIDALRGRLLESGAKFTVVKNTLTRRAAEAAGVDALLAMLEGRRRSRSSRATATWSRSRRRSPTPPARRRCSRSAAA